MTDKQIDALKLAREALEYISSHYMSLPKVGCMALAAIEEALAEQPAQEDGPITEGWQITVAHGHSGYGVYAHMEDYPEEGAVLVQAIEQPAQQHIEHCLWARNGNQPCPHVQPVQQQEPVAWATRMGEYAHIHWGAKRPEYPMVYEVPLYTSPPASKPWVGLTDDQIAEATQDIGLTSPLARWRIARAIEAAHGITGGQHG